MPQFCMWKIFQTGLDLMFLGPRAKLLDNGLRERWMRCGAKKHAGLREAVGSNGDLMRGEKELLFRDL